MVQRKVSPTDKLSALTGPWYYTEKFKLALPRESGDDDDGSNLMEI